MGPIVFSYKLKEQGVSEKINRMPEVINANEYCWFHLSANHKKSIEWLDHHTDLQPIARDMLLSKNTRPNITRFHNGLLLTLRAVNTSDEETNDVFNAINVWISDKYIITSRNIKIKAIEDLVSKIDEGDVPLNKGQFLVELIHHLQKRISQIVRDIEETTESLEESVLEQNSKEIRTIIINHRKLISQVRKYIVPQREVLHNLVYDKYKFIDEDSIVSLRYYFDKMVRLVEELDLTREHLVLVQEEVVNIQNDSMNKSMYRISIISALFLPLGFITGMLGVNIGGVPGIESGNSFLILSIVSLVYLLAGTLYFVIQKRF